VTVFAVKFENTTMEIADLTQLKLSVKSIGSSAKKRGTNITT